MDHDSVKRLCPIVERVLIDSRAMVSADERHALSELDQFFQNLESSLHRKLQQQQQLTCEDRRARVKDWFALLQQPNYAALRLYIVRFGYEALARQIDVRNHPPNFVEHAAFYGTLQHSGGVQHEIGVDKQLKRLGPCRIRGKLIDHAGYPGLIPGSGEVYGELYQVTDPTVFDALDAYEEFDRSNPARSLFHRHYVRLAEPNLDAWVYFANTSKSNAPTSPQSN